MTDLVLEIEKEFPTKFPKYISNLEIGRFLEERKKFINIQNFQALKAFFLIQKKLNRSIFETWEKENKSLFLFKENLQKQNRSFPLQKEFVELLRLRKYSQRTIKAYSSTLLLLNEYLEKNDLVSIDRASFEQIKKYFLFLTLEKKVSDSAIRVCRFAIEYYRNEIVLKPIKLDFAYGIRKKESIPTIFSKDEVKKILNSTNNLKHKMVLSLLYSSGLRLSEVIHLKVKDVNLDELTLVVKEGKGKKDRISVFSEKLVSDISLFLEDRKPNEFLFLSNQKSASGSDKPLSPRTVEKIFEQALQKSGVKKQGSPHDFRHSFATHLLESGTDIHFIQKLLGHKNLSTTSIYTKLANPKLAGVKSPY